MDFMESVLWMDNAGSGHRLAINKVMLTIRATSFLYNCRDETPEGFKHILSLTSGQNDLKSFNKLKEDETKKVVAKELTVGSNNMGKGYRLIGNTVMLLARVGAKNETGMDLMPYDYIDMLNTVSSPLLSPNMTLINKPQKKKKRAKKQKVQKPLV